MEHDGAAGAVAALRSRLDRFDATGELGLITGAQAQREAAAVRAIASDLPSGYDHAGRADTGTVSAMLQLARWHWYRHLVLTPRPDQIPGGSLGATDLPAAVALAHRLEAVAPHRLPLSMRALLGPSPQAVPADPPALGGGPAEWFTEAVLLMRRAEAEGDYSVIDRADALLTRAVAATAAHDPRRPDYLWALGRLNRDRFSQHGDTGALDRCVDLETQALESTPPDHPSRAVRLLTLAGALADSFELSGDPDALDDAVDLLREATRRSPNGTALHTTALACLGQVTRRRWQARRQRFDLDEAIQSLRTAAAGQADDWDPQEALPARRALAELYRERYGRDGAPSDLDAAVAAYREAAESADSLAQEATLRRTLAELLLARFDRVPDPADLVAAERTLRRTAAITPPQDPLHVAALAELSAALHRRYLAGSDLEPLRAAAGCSRDAVRLTPPQDPDRPARLAALGSQLRLLFTRTGQEELLAEAVAALREAAGARWASKEPGRPDVLTELAGALLGHSELAADRPAAAEAVAAAREAVRASHEADPQRPQRLLVLGRALNRLAELSPGRPDPDPDEAPRVLAELTQEGPDSAAPWATLAAAHRLRHRRTGDRSDLQHATALLRRALDAEPEEEEPAGPQRPALLAALGDTALASARQQPDTAMLRTATDALASAVAALDDDEPSRAAVLLDLSAALELAAGRDSGGDPALRARAAARAACGVRAAPSLTRLRAARQWARLAGTTGHHGETLEAYRHALHLLDLLAWSSPAGGPGSDRDSDHSSDHDSDRDSNRDSDQDAAGRRVLAAEFGGLPADAAAAALDAGRHEEAVAVLEQGHAALAGLALGPTGVWAARLRQQAPDLAERLAGLQRQLEPPPWPRDAGPLVGALGDPGAAAAARRTRLRLAQEREDLLERIRERPGLAGFAGPVPFALLSEAAAGGPVVLLNVAPARSDALLVTAGGVRSIPLRALDQAGIASHATAFTRSDGARVEADAVAERAAALYWLWDTVAGPVLRELGLGTATAAPATRLWWCCPGPLGLLPLPAATARPASGRAADSVLDRVVSSWTPSLAALLPDPVPAGTSQAVTQQTTEQADHQATGPARPGPGAGRRQPDREQPEATQARAGRPGGDHPGGLQRPGRRQRFGGRFGWPRFGRTPRSRSGGGLLVVTGPPDPGGAADRHRAEDALARAASRLVRLAGPELDPDSVVTAADGPDLVHLAGPVRYRPADADGGALLLLNGQRLPVHRLTGPGRLFVAECEPDGGPGAARFLLGPAEAALLAGFRQVVAPAWPVEAGTVARVAVLVYERVAAGEPSSAAAVHEAARRERVRNPDRPELWAAFRHHGR